MLLLISLIFISPIDLKKLNFVLYLKLFREISLLSLSIIIALLLEKTRFLFLSKDKSFPFKIYFSEVIIFVGPLVKMVFSFSLNSMKFVVKILLYLSVKIIFFFKVRTPESLLYSAKSLLITSLSLVKTETSLLKIVVFLLLSIVIFFALI